jgi:hypothetical protein
LINVRRTGRCLGCFGDELASNLGDPSRNRTILAYKEWTMKTRLLWLSSVLVIAFALTFSVTTPAAPSPKPAPAAAAVPAPEPHPEIREALEALRKAKFRMEHAAHDFGGHRVDAIKATDEAIRQLQICLQFDR